MIINYAKKTTEYLRKISARAMDDSLEKWKAIKRYHEEISRFEEKKTEKKVWRL